MQSEALRKMEKKEKSLSKKKKKAEEKRLKEEARKQAEEEQKKAQLEKERFEQETREKIRRELEEEMAREEEERKKKEEEERLKGDAEANKLHQLHQERENRIKEESAKVKNAAGTKKIGDEDMLSQRFHYHIRLYRGKDPEGNPIMVKIVALTTVSPKYRDHLMKEGVKIMRYLVTSEHLNILKIIDLYEMTAKKLYIFTEPFGEQHLEEYIKTNGAIKEADMKAPAKQILDGVEFLHSRGIGHRNLKTSHILLDKDFTHFKITGFGLSCICYDPAENKVIHFPKNRSEHPHLAPESVSGAEKSSEAGGNYDVCIADIWSYGVILFQCLTKRNPFDFNDEQDLELQWQIRLKKSKKQVSHECSDFLEAIFTPDVSKRPKALDLLFNPWLK